MEGLFNDKSNDYSSEIEPELVNLHPPHRDMTKKDNETAGTIRALNLPPLPQKLRRDANSGRTEIYDRWRERWVALTPEEWVRQHFVAMLVEERGYVSGRIANEVTINLNGMTRRCDTVVYNASAEPLMIVEYKAPNIRITRRVLDQIARYCMVVRAPYLAVSNGMVHFCWRADASSGQWTFVPEIPRYDAL